MANHQLSNVIQLGCRANNHINHFVEPCESSSLSPRLSLASLGRLGFLRSCSCQRPPPVPRVVDRAGAGRLHAGELPGALRFCLAERATERVPLE